MLLQLRQYERENIRGEGVTELMDVYIPMEFIRDGITAPNDGPEYL
jgi:hypothetical protein